MQRTTPPPPPAARRTPRFTSVSAWGKLIQTERLPDVMVPHGRARSASDPRPDLGWPMTKEESRLEVLAQVSGLPGPSLTKQKNISESCPSPSPSVPCILGSLRSADQL